MPRKTTRAAFGAWTAVVLLAALWALVVERGQPPSPRGIDTPATEFSAGRAQAALARVLGDGRAHPVGSVANDAVRERIADELRALGVEPELRSVWACNAWGTCATVNNVLARLAAAAGSAAGGVAGKKAVLLAVHYDSVGAGAGASDDGVGVAAALEAVRALRAGGPLARPVLVWIDDGEEAGLLGAEAFARLPEAKEVGAVVNLEARGTRGASLMFETRRDNAWVIRLLAKALPRPATNSVFYTIYQRLPNDTDFSVFKRDGLQGVNFAFVGDVTHYHTGLDDLAHVALGTLQHQGDNALAMVRAFAGADLESQPPGDAVYFDVLALGVVRWPASLSVPLALLALLLVVVSAWRLRGAAGLTGRQTAWGLAAWLLVVAASAAAAFALQKALTSLGALPLSWVAHPGPALLAVWVAPLLAGLALVPALARRAGPAGLWAGAWLAAGLIALALAATLPGTCYLLLAPTLVAGLCGALLGAASSDGELKPVAVSLPAAVAALTIFPLAWGLWDGMGAPVLGAIGASAGLVVASLAPALAGASRRLRSGALVVVLGGAVVAIWVPSRSVEHPESLNLLYVDDRDTATASVLATPASGVLPSGLAAAAPFARPTARQFPWQKQPALATPAAALVAAAPEVVVLANEALPAGRRVRLLLRSGRTSRLRLYVPGSAGLSEPQIAGQALPAPTGRDRIGATDERWFSLLTVPPEGVEISATLKSAAPVEVLIQDLSFGLPPAVQGLRAACGPLAVPLGNGDLTIVQRRVKI